MKIYKVSTGTDFDGSLFAPYADIHDDWTNNLQEAETIYNSVKLKDFDTGTKREDGIDDFTFAQMECGRPCVTLFSATVKPAAWKKAMSIKQSGGDWCDWLNYETDFDWIEEKERFIDFPIIDGDYNYSLN